MAYQANALHGDVNEPSERGGEKKHLEFHTSGTYFLERVIFFLFLLNVVEMPLGICTNLFFFRVCGLLTKDSLFFSPALN